MFNRALFVFIFTFIFMGPVLAQNPTCPTRPLGDSSNACASTAFVQNATGGGGGTPQSANTVFAGPTSGGSAPPAFRPLVNPDLPDFSQPDAGATLRTYLSKTGDVVSVLDYLPVGQPDGTTDNSTGFQLAANDMCARSSFGGTIIVPSPPSAAQYKAHDINNTCGNYWLGTTPGGVGSTNQTTTSTIVRGGTSIDYSDATSYFMQWQVAGFPAFKSGAHINGGGIAHMSLFDGASTANTFNSEGTQDWTETYIVINGAYNGTFMKGDEFPVTTNISMYGTRNANYTIIGDLTGQTVSGAACTTSNGDCSTRNDAWFGAYLTNIDNLKTNTVFTITGFVGTPTIQHTSGEGPATGMFVSCPTGLATNMSQCPTFGRFDDNQFEFYKTNGILAQDFLNFYFDHLYSVGDDSINNNNAFAAYSQNYTASSAPVGVLDITNSQLFVAGNDCVYLGGTMASVSIQNSKISGCNTLNSGGNGINSSGTLSHLKVQNNEVGTVDSYGGSVALGRAVALSTTTTWAEITNNIWGNVSTAAAPVLNASAQPWTIHIEGNIGPGGAPTVGACGTGPVISGSDRAMLVTVGTGTPTSCTVTFGTIWSTPPICTVSPAPGAAAFTGVSTSDTAVVIAGSALSGGYQVLCSTN
jgi:hypothetical protein